jgi:2-oxoglutarate dehydrogenase E2 component (dihydrolipoamide succinyltransferase)
MKSEIKIPSMGESISEVVIGTILAPSGKTVKADEELLELETDKVNQVLYASQNGAVTWNVRTGDTAKIGQVIGFIDSQAVPEKKMEPIKEPLFVEKKEGEPKSVPMQAAKKSQVALQPAEENVSIRQTKDYFLADLKQKEESSAHKKTELPQPKASGQREIRRKMSNIRKVIANRLVEAQQTMVMLTTFNEVDMSAVMQVRESHKESFAKKHGVKLGFMSFFVKAVVSALKAFPDLNSFIEGDEIVQRQYYDIGIAVGTERGVIVPVVRDCDKLSFAGIESAIVQFANQSREGKIAIEDLQGGGFTITNGGTYGSLLSTPVVNPPQSGILGMHKIEKRPVVIGDQITIRPMMYVALSYDHRIVDGKEAVSFLVHIKELLEDPTRLLLDL